MSLRAKMKCTTVTRDEYGNESVSCYPVTGDSDENKMWSKFTPGGQLALTISNPAAQGQFVAGAEYFVDVTPVPVERAGAPAPETLPEGATP